MLLKSWIIVLAVASVAVHTVRVAALMRKKTLSIATKANLPTLQNKILLPTLSRQLRNNTQSPLKRFYSTSSKKLSFSFGKKITSLIKRREVSSPLRYTSAIQERSRAFVQRIRDEVKRRAPQIKNSLKNSLNRIEQRLSVGLAENVILYTSLLVPTMALITAVPWDYINNIPAYVLVPLLFLGLEKVGVGYIVIPIMITLSIAIVLKVLFEVGEVFEPTEIRNLQDDMSRLERLLYNMAQEATDPEDAILEFNSIFERLPRKAQEKIQEVVEVTQGELTSMTEEIKEGISNEEQQRMETNIMRAQFIFFALIERAFARKYAKEIDRLK